MRFLSSSFPHRFCRYEEGLQNLLSVAVQKCEGKKTNKLCFIKVCLYFTLIGLKILWKAKIRDFAVAFIQAISIP